jgi:hypothetical protein
MPSPSYTLSVPADEPYRGLAAESVRVFLRASGRVTGEGAEAFIESVAAAVDRLSAGDANIDLAVVADASRVDVRLTCAGTSETLTHAVVAAGS